MNYRNYLTAVLLTPLISNWTIAQPIGEAGELSLEELDAAYTAADAAREAKAWSDVVIDRSTSDPLARMSAASDLVVRGTIASQRVVYDENDLPLTHTTLSISEVLKGSYSDAQITLVQEGGPSKTKPGNIIMVSDAHYFTVGNKELLFLELDPDSAHETRRVAVNQRFGVHNGKMFDENGRGLIYTETQDAPGYRLGWSRNRNPHPRFNKFRIGSHEISKQFGDDDDGVDSGGDVSIRALRPVRPGYQASMDVSALRAALNK